MNLNEIKTRIKRSKPLLDEKPGRFEMLCGLWEGRTDVSLETVRNKAWKRYSLLGEIVRGN
jgi:hypothetical protein